MGSKEASHESLAKIISTNVSIQFLRRVDDRRFDVSRGARVHRSACARLESGLDRRAGTSLRYPSREWDRRQPDQMKEAAKPSGFLPASASASVA